MEPGSNPTTAPARMPELTLTGLRARHVVGAPDVTGEEPILFPASHKQTGGSVYRVISDTTEHASPTPSQKVDASETSKHPSPIVHLRDGRTVTLLKPEASNEIVTATV